MIKIPAYLVGDSSRADGSRSLRFATQEVTPETVAEFQRLNGAFGWLVFAPQQTEVEVPKEFIEDDRKSPSERLYAVLYVYWKQQKVDVPFDMWRLRYMEKLIEGIKSKLEV
jgi:hypothetical protein